MYTTTSQSTSTIYGAFPSTDKSPRVELDSSWMLSSLEYMKAQGIPKDTAEKSLLAVVDDPHFMWATPGMRDTFKSEVDKAWCA